MLNEKQGFGYSCMTMVDENTVGILYEGVKELYFFLKQNKVVGAFINGSTGEGVSLTRKERMKMIRAW
jgi:dihydrodipicolinate synthase/N-acetylneuraminate lyase